MRRETGQGRGLHVTGEGLLPKIERIGAAKRTRSCHPWLAKAGKQPQETMPHRAVVPFSIKVSPDAGLAHHREVRCMQGAGPKRDRDLTSIGAACADADLADGMEVHDVAVFKRVC
jgi:hypothetical protein